MIRAWFGVVLLAAVIVPRISLACSCVAGPTSPYGFESLSDTLTLPVNAKGVLFSPPYDPNDPSSEVKLKASSFSIGDEESNKKISVRINKIHLSKLDDLYPKLTLYRIEPKEPFKANHHYSFSFKGKTTDQTESSRKRVKYYLRVEIQNSKIDASALSKIQFKRNGEAKIDSISTPMAVQCFMMLKSKIQDIEYILPDELKPFSESILFFTQYSSEIDKKQVWEYDSNLCSTSRFGHQGANNTKDLVYISEHDMGYTRLKTNRKYQISASWAFPEVSGEVYSDPGFEFEYMTK